MSSGLEHVPFSVLADRAGAKFDSAEDALLLEMLGQRYTVRKDGISLCGQKAPEAHGEVIRDYLRSARGALVEVPWRSVGDLGVQDLAMFRSRVEQPLAQHARDLIGRGDDFFTLFEAVRSAALIGSDMAFNVRALPKVHIHIELSQESEDFPAEAWMLFSSNASSFLTVQGIQQLAELCKDRIISLLRIY